MKLKHPAEHTSASVRTTSERCDQKQVYKLTGRRTEDPKSPDTEAEATIEACVEQRRLGFPPSLSALAGHPAYLKLHGPIPD